MKDLKGKLEAHAPSWADEAGAGSHAAKPSPTALACGKAPRWYLGLILKWAWVWVPYLLSAVFVLIVAGWIVAALLFCACALLILWLKVVLPKLESVSEKLMSPPQSSTRKRDGLDKAPSKGADASEQNELSQFSGGGIK